MEVSIGVLVLFLVTKQIVCESADNSTASNNTISSTTAKPLLKKTTGVFKGISSADKKNASLVKESNITVTTSTVSPTHNTTKAHLATNSTAGTTTTTGTTKPSAATHNTTHVQGDEVKKTTSTLKENATKEDSSTSKATQGYSAGSTAISESAVTSTTAPEERDLKAAGEDASSTSDRDIIEANSTLPEEETDEDTGPVSDDERDDLTSSEEVGNSNLEHQTYNDTERADSVSVLDAQQHQEYCAGYIRKLVSETLTKHADRLDPLLLRDTKIAFDIPFMLSSVDGQLGLYDGKLTGISQGRPFDECKAEMQESQVRLISGIYIDEALINYKGRAAFLDIGPKITIGGKLSGISADLSIIVPKDGGIGRIETFRVRKIRRTVTDIKDIKDLCAVDWAIELINEEATKIFSFAFRKSIESDLRKALQEEIGKITYP